jgi:hypothetical protein
MLLLLLFGFQKVHLRLLCISFQTCNFCAEYLYVATTWNSTLTTGASFFYGITGASLPDSGRKQANNDIGASEEPLIMFEMNC